MKMKRPSLIKRLFLPVIALVMALSTTSAYAMLVTYSFQGAIADVSDNLFTPGAAGNNGFSSALQLRGTYTFNTMAAPNGNGNYSASQSFGTNVIRLTNGAFDQYRVQSSVSGNQVKGLSLESFDLRLRDATGTAFSSNAQLPTDPPSLGSFNRNQWRLNFSNGGFVTGSVIALQAVPLPAAVILFGAGLISLVGLGAGGLRNLRRPHQA